MGQSLPMNMKNDLLAAIKHLDSGKGSIRMHNDEHCVNRPSIF